MLAGAACVHRLEIPTPELSGVALPEQPASHIDVPVSVDLSSVPAAAEAQVPPGINAMGAWTMVADDRIGIKYRVSRSPFSIRLSSDTLTASVLVEYEAEACVRTKKPPPLKGYVCPKVASCGQGEPLRQARVSMSSPVKWSPDWHLTSRTSFHVDYLNRCRVTFLQYDVTPHIDGFLRNHLGSAAKKMDERLAAASDVRAMAERAWAAISTPQQVRPGIWLTLRPSQVRVAPLNGSGLTVTTSLGLTAKPELFASAEPVAEPAPPLPPLAVEPPGRGFSVRLAGRVPLYEATRLLREAVAGKELEAEGHRLRIDDVEVSGQDDSLLVRLAVTIPTGFLKWSKGIVYLVGRPRYDVGTGIISVDELDYSVDSRSALVAIGDWLLHDVVRAKLREKARWRVGEQLAQARADLEAGLNRDLGNGVRLKGTVAEVQPLFVRVFEGAVVAQVQATGAAELSVTAAPLASQ